MGRHKRHAGHSVPGLPQLDPSNAIPGYEFATFEPRVVPKAEWMQSHSVLGQADKWRRSLPVFTSSQLTESQAKSYLDEHVAEQSCCWGSSPVKTMTVTDIQPASTFHYTLETFVETRKVAWTFKRWQKHVAVQGVGQGRAPNPWEFQLMPAQLFKNEKRIVDVPFTSVVKSCHGCYGAGSSVCDKCGGVKWVLCNSCDGTGLRKKIGTSDEQPQTEVCTWCRNTRYGKGRVECKNCGASGKKVCHLCGSSGLIVCFIQLTVNWEVKSSEYVLEKTGLPLEHLSQVTGDVTFSEQGVHVSPLSDVPADAVAAASSVHVQQHQTLYGNQIICQRHNVRVVPVTFIKYAWSGGKSEFFVYGNERKVYVPNYPQTCCWGCSIL